MEWKVNNFKLHEHVRDFGYCVVCLCNMYMKVHIVFCMYTITRGGVNAYMYNCTFTCIVCLMTLY